MPPAKAQALKRTDTFTMGHIHNGKQRYLCKACRRQFTPEGSKKVIPEETKIIIDKLLVEKLSRAGIARAVHVSETWLQVSVNDKYQRVERQVKVPVKKGSSHRVRRSRVMC